MVHVAQPPLHCLRQPIFLWRFCWKRDGHSPSPLYSMNPAYCTYFIQLASTGSTIWLLVALEANFDQKICIYTNHIIAVYKKIPFVSYKRISSIKYAFPVSHLHYWATPKHHMRHPSQLILYNQSEASWHDYLSYAFLSCDWQLHALAWRADAL